MSLAATFSAALIGSFFSVEAIDGWYAELVKPAWNPPSYLFGPVWTLLYTLMAIAAYRIWMKREHVDAPTALYVYGVQLVLNALWSPLFFGAMSPATALADISLLFVMILLCMVYFFRIDRIATALLVPYLCWVGFATVLNAAILALNMS